LKNLRAESCQAGENAIVYFRERGAKWGNLSLGTGFELTLRFHTRESTMSDWSRDAAQKFIAQKREKPVQDEMVLHNEDIIKRKAPEVWDKLSEEFDRKCSEFNSELEISNVLAFDRTDPYELEITRTDTHARLTVTFIPELQTVTVKGLKESRDFRFEVFSGTSEVGLFHAESGTNNCTLSFIEEIPTELLDVFLAD
jgi:hypothetical protein